MATDNRNTSVLKNEKQIYEGTGENNNSFMAIYFPV